MGNSKGDAINSETMNEENKTKKLFCLIGCEKWDKIDYGNTVPRTTPLSLKMWIYTYIYFADVSASSFAKKSLIWKMGVIHTSILSWNFWKLYLQQPKKSDFEDLLTMFGVFWFYI